MALPALDGIRASWNDTCNYDNLNRRRVTPQRFPVVLEPAGDPSDLAVLRARRSEIMDLIHAHGAVLLRRWTTKELPAFVESLERVLGAEAEGTHYHKISMLRGEGRKATAHPHVFSASEAPATFFIPHHCEQSYINLRCRYISFWCPVAAKRGGQTPLFDMERVFSDLDARLQGRLQECAFKLGNWSFEASQYPLVFGTEDAAEVKRIVADYGMDQVWRNFWYANSLHDTLDMTLPLEDRVAINDAVFRHASFFQWESGDVLICDNIKMGHARLAFERPRTVLTAMVGLYDAQAGRDKCAPARGIASSQGYVGAHGPCAASATARAARRRRGS
ncbi:hypothetical protein JL721_11406 [Aureococcus anophagefferens]|nr:hypothetical protein JL721_11406 [Aureococcus anophagefferens]